MPDKTKAKPVKKWNLSQDDYIELLESIDANNKTIISLMNDLKRIKIRMGI